MMRKWERTIENEEEVEKKEELKMWKEKGLRAPSRRLDGRDGGKDCWK